MISKERSREVARRVRHVLMTEWDPIGVAGVPQAADEYDSYVGGVCGLLQRGASEAEIFAHLRDVEVDWMGITVSEVKRKAVASSLKELGHYLDETLR